MDAPPKPAGPALHLSLVVLCYRSEEAIVPVVDKLHRMFSYFNFPYELILVGNYIEGARDRTPQIVAALAARLPNTRAIALPKKGMMGWDMRAGIDAAVGKYICVIDGDGQFPFESIFSCLLRIETEDLDLVKTYRVRRDDGLYRTLVSVAYNALFRLLFGGGLRDVNSKPKIFRRDKLRLLDLRTDDWFTDAEIVIRAKELGLKMAEVPIHFYAIDQRTSFVKPGAILEFVGNLWRYRFRRTKPSASEPRGDEVLRP
ncbi:MAG: glycosyltransferase family 2 protein [Elusimicrobia bacterium]|nr:glycosyltransferase family 2 protein [Elusimicrobiota bacterium]